MFIWKWWWQADTVQLSHYRWLIALRMDLGQLLPDSAQLKQQAVAPQAGVSVGDRGQGSNSPQGSFFHVSRWNLYNTHEWVETGVHILEDNSMSSANSPSRGLLAQGWLFATSWLVGKHKRKGSALAQSPALASWELQWGWHDQGIKTTLWRNKSSLGGESGSWRSEWKEKKNFSLFSLLGSEKQRGPGTDLKPFLWATSTFVFRLNCLITLGVWKAQRVCGWLTRSGGSPFLLF